MSHAAKRRAIVLIRSTRIYVGLAMLAEVIAGACGYGDTVKVYAGILGVLVALGLKATHTIS
jgi:hypothetical protein